MAPHRRRPAPTAGQAPPIRRPKVAGLRNRPEQPPVEHADVELDQESVKNLLNSVRGTPPARRRAAAEDLAAETAVLPRITDDEPPAEPEIDEPAIAGVLDTEETVEPEIDPETNEPPVKAAVDTEDAPVRTARKRRQATTSDTEDAPVRTDRKRSPTASAAPATKPRSDTIRPAGKRRTQGAARPTDLEAAETDAGVESKRSSRHARVDDRPSRPRAQTQISLAIILTVVAVVLAGAAVFFRGKANDLTSGDSNTALTDSATTSQIKGQLTNAIKQTFSYNYTDLDSTEKSVKENLTGKALCEYNLLFGEVKKLAPEQKIVLDTTVRELAVTRIDGDRAEALVYIDQLSTRVDVNKTVAVGGQFAVRAQRVGGNWKITEFDMFGQPLFNGKQAPTC